jgi:DNA-binding transcriptional regulator YiaG
VLARFLAAEVKVATFARTHGIVRSTLQMWAAGKRPLNAKALSRVVRGLDVEGK